MKRLSLAGMKLFGLVASLALALGVASTQAACIMVFHQPKVPQGMGRFVKG
jgi:cyclic lactone autoinducer peptide